MDNREAGPSGRRSAFLVATGILASRLAGLVRDRVFAHYFGDSVAADAFRSAFRIPNFLQNLFGEGVLSASFIPVYAGLLAKGDEKEANRVAGAILSILALTISLLVVGGMALSPILVDLIAPGFEASKRDLTVALVRTLFPGAGLLALSAWCLGVLNSHRRFLLSYAAPVVWNAAIIATLLTFGGRLGEFPLAEYVAWGAVAGSGLQFLIQLPVVIRLAKGLRLGLYRRSEEVRRVLVNFAPVFLSRGVVQVSAYVDTILASFLPTGAMAALTYAQTIYVLPVSLFGMSVSVAELPEMSRASGGSEEVAGYLRRRLDAALRHIAFLVIPSAVAFLALGDIVASGIYQTGRFSARDSTYVWSILAGSAVGLLASTLGRLYASSYWALKDTRTPLNYAVIRVALTIGLGYVFSLHVPGWLGIEAKWGVAGLTASAGIAGWIEFGLLRRGMNRRIGRTGLSGGFLARLWIAAGVAAGIGWLLKDWVWGMQPVFRAMIVLGAFGVTYFAACWLARVPEVEPYLGRLGLRRRAGRE
jgi:putative peptidoglycan lipid II flippase